MKALRSQYYLVAVVILTMANLAGAADPSPAPLARKDLDQRLYYSIHDITKEGVHLYNDFGDETGCYRLFEAALKTAAPLLDHRPELQKFVTEHLKAAESDRNMIQKAFTLRAGMDEILKVLRKDIVAAQPGPAPEKAPAPKPAGKTGTETMSKGGGKALWDRLGGEKAVRAVVKELIAESAKDPKVNLTRNGKFKLDEKGLAQLEQLLVEFVSQATGGPLKYTGRGVKPVHAGMGITDAEFNAMAGHLVDTLKKFNVPQKEIDELIAIVGATKTDIVEKK
ncbi:MAG TPA: group 1 truncated hemoglobin [Gemmataceae bacterium]|jgi:hemoglobin|nr:group 1 truncated hemoglobin [Gemmataceae bacterium]